MILYVLNEPHLRWKPFFNFLFIFLIAFTLFFYVLDNNLTWEQRSIPVLIYIGLVLLISLISEHAVIFTKKEIITKNWFAYIFHLPISRTYPKQPIHQFQLGRQWGFYGGLKLQLKGYHSPRKTKLAKSFQMQQPALPALYSPAFSLASKKRLLKQISEVRKLQTKWNIK